MDKALEITDLIKRYPTGTEALLGVSLDIAAGAMPSLWSEVLSR